jgi:hypothetical protein
MKLSSCLDCNEPYGDSLFLWISDSLWRSIGCEPSDFLCVKCMLDRIYKKGMTAGYLIMDPGNHDIDRAAMKISAKHCFKNYE